MRQVEWRGYVDEAELPASLLRCHALAVTQRPEARGLLWPSKLGLVMSLPRPIVWIGPTDGAIAAELRALPHAGIFAPGQGRDRLPSPPCSSRSTRASTLPWSS